MSINADQGTAAHIVLEKCLATIYRIGVPLYPHQFIGTEIEIRDTKHKDLSPSGGDRWMSCFGSFQMQQPFRKPPDPNNVRRIVFDEDYAKAVQEVLDYVERRVQELKKETDSEFVEVYTELKVSLAQRLGTNQCDGILDIALVAGKQAEIIDAKFGAGVLVSSETKQLDLYLLGFTSEPAFGSIESVTLTIAQPRYKHGSNFDSRFIDLTNDWVSNFSEEVKAAIEATKQEPPILVPSEKACKFCLARGSCSAAAEAALTKTSVLDGHLPLTAEAVFSAASEFASLEPFFLTAAQVRGILDGAGFLRGMLTAVEEYAIKSLKERSASPEISSAYKLVRKNGRRKWAYSPDETEKRLKRIKIKDKDSGKTRALGRKDVLTTELKSVKNVEEMLKKMGVPPTDARFDAFQALVTKPMGELTLVHVSDPRPAIEVPTMPQGALEDGPDIDAPNHKP